MDLEAINFTPEKLLLAVERSTRARYRYVHQCNAQEMKVDPAIDHQLINHMTLLQDIAQAVGLSSEGRRRGHAARHREGARRGAGLARVGLANRRAPSP